MHSVQDITYTATAQQQADQRHFYDSSHRIHEEHDDDFEQSAQPIHFSRNPLPLPAEKSVRYFGDTDLESQQSASRFRYAPKAKLSRSASSAAGMGGVRRFDLFSSAQSAYYIKQGIYCVSITVSVVHGYLAVFISCLLTMA